MKDIKIAFFDIDGTLVDFQKKYMTEKTRQALCALRANGIRICIATGRTPMTVPKFEGVAFDAYLTFNGAYCYDAQGTILSRTIPGQDVERLIATPQNSIGPSVYLPIKSWVPTVGSGIWRTILPSATWSWSPLRTLIASPLGPSIRLW